MTDIPQGYQVGETERKYLEQLEAFRQQEIPLTPSDFCKKLGLAGPSSIRRYRVLKAALNQYGWQTEPSRMRGSQPNVLEKVELGDDPRIAKLEVKVQRLEKQRAEAEVWRHQLRDCERDLNELRGLLMALVTHFSRGDAARGKDIEQRIVQLIRERLPDEQVPDLAQGDSVTTDLMNALIDDTQPDW